MTQPDQTFLEAVAQDFADLPDPGRMAHIALRLFFAALLGGVLGYQRERIGKAAGLRTHMLVAMGSAFFIMVPLTEGVSVNDSSRVVQGIVTGIGFLDGDGDLDLVVN